MGTRRAVRGRRRGRSGRRARRRDERRAVGGGGVGGERPHRRRRRRHASRTRPSASTGRARPRRRRRARRRRPPRSKRLRRRRSAGTRGANVELDRARKPSLYPRRASSRRRQRRTRTSRRRRRLLRRAGRARRVGAEHLGALVGAHVPQPERAVLRAREELAPLRAQREAVEQVGVPLVRAHARVRLEVPRVRVAVARRRVQQPRRRVDRERVRLGQRADAPRRSACVGLRSSKSGATVPASSCDHRQPRISSSEPVINMSPGAKASE